MKNRLLPLLYLALLVACYGLVLYQIARVYLKLH